MPHFGWQERVFKDQLSRLEKQRDTLIADNAALVDELTALQKKYASLRRKIGLKPRHGW